MARNSECAIEWLDRKLAIPVKVVVATATMLPLLVLWAMVGSSYDDNVVLSRNEVVDDGAGGRIWRGTMFNPASASDPAVYREVAVTIRFLDSNGQTVGEVRAQADQLGPEQGINLEAPLPPNAVTMQVYSLQWRLDRGKRVIGQFLGPWGPWEFGYLQYHPTNREHHS